MPENSVSDWQKAGEAVRSGRALTAIKLIPGLFISVAFQRFVNLIPLC